MKRLIYVVLAVSALGLVAAPALAADDEQQNPAESVSQEVSPAPENSLKQSDEEKDKQSESDTKPDGDGNK